MKLQEKILYCRKKGGLSQEALAEQLGVSRQAISKWETGDAVPEISKLLLLAKVFGVTTDWLLNEEDPSDEKADVPPFTVAQPMNNSSWIDSVPGLLGRLLRRFGWLFGVYLAVVGAGFTGLGALARYMVRRMFSGNIFGSGNMFPEGAIDFSSIGTQMMNPFSELIANNPVSIMGTIIMIIGILMMIAGVVLAIVLKKRSVE